MKKKLLITVIAVLTLGILAVWAVPGFADAAANNNQPTPGVQQVNKIRILVRLMTVQDEAKVDTFLAKAQADGKITADQLTAIKQMWTSHHAQFKPGSALVRLLQVRDGTKVGLALDKAVTGGKISQAQSQKTLTLWQKLHNK